MINRDFVSIIVPMYNVEQYVEKCLLSLINQTYKNIKIYAVSDGSPDNSILVAKKVAEKDKRIEIVEKENGGYGSVLEYMIDYIDTKYFLICDPDDWLDDTAIEKLVWLSKKNNSDLTIANFNLYCDGVVDKSKKVYNKNYIIESEKDYIDLTCFAFTTVSPHSKLYLTSKAKNINFPKKVSFTDTLLYYVYLSRIEKASFLDEQLSYYYEDRPGNSMSQVKKYSKNVFDQEMIVFNCIFEQLNYDSIIIDAILYSLFTKYALSLKNIKYIEDKVIRKECKKVISKELKKFTCHRKNMKKYINDILLKKFLKKIRLYLLTCSMNKIFINILY